MTSEPSERRLIPRHLLNLNWDPKLNPDWNIGNTGLVSRQWDDFGCKFRRLFWARLLIGCDRTWLVWVGVGEMIGLARSMATPGQSRPPWYGVNADQN